MIVGCYILRINNIEVYYLKPKPYGVYYGLVILIPEVINLSVNDNVVLITKFVGMSYLIPQNNLT